MIFTKTILEIKTNNDKNSIVDAKLKRIMKGYNSRIAVKYEYSENSRIYALLFMFETNHKTTTMCYISGMEFVFYQEKMEFYQQVEFSPTKEIKLKKEPCIWLFTYYKKELDIYFKKLFGI